MMCNSVPRFKSRRQRSIRALPSKPTQPDGHTDGGSVNQSAPVTKMLYKDALDTGLPRAYSTDLYNQKCSAVFERFYESYPERDANIYASEL
jgi:hypothetical protein